MRVHSRRELGALLRSRRRALGFTQADVAARAQVQRAWLARLEAGGENPTFAKLLAVTQALSLELDLSSGHVPGRTARRLPVSSRRVVARAGDAREVRRTAPDERDGRASSRLASSSDPDSSVATDGAGDEADCRPGDSATGARWGLLPGSSAGPPSGRRRVSTAQALLESVLRHDRPDPLQRGAPGHRRREPLDEQPDLATVVDGDDDEPERARRGEG